jgi:hypothetical protein
LAEHGIFPTIERMLFLQVEFANHQVDNNDKVWNEDACLGWIHTIIKEAKEQSHASQHANVAVHLDTFLLVHEVAEFGSCHSTDDTEQHSERQRTSDDAANQDGYKNQACNCALNEIFHID